MISLNRDLFIKLMAKTTSDNDAEALMFLRRANAMLKAANITWPEIVSDQAKAERKLFEAFTYRTPTPGPSRYGRPVKSKKKVDKGRNTDPAIGDMLEELRHRQHTMSFLMFLSGVTAQWRSHKFVTDDQLAMIRKAHGMARSPF
jgi:hypothetical protein